MKTALLLIPETNDQIDRHEYLELCIERCTKEGFIPFTPVIYEYYSPINIQEFINRILPYCDAIILFIDYGIDKIMFEIMDRSISAKIEIIYRRVISLKTTMLYKTPGQILMEISRKTGISVDLLQGKSRLRTVADARFVYFRRAREISKASLSSIGLLVGRHHASVLHGISEAYNQKVVVNLYNKCYEETKIEAQTLGSGKKSEFSGTKREPIQRPVLPYRSMDKREQGISERESTMQSLSEKRCNNPIRGYRPHNS